MSYGTNPFAMGGWANPQNPISLNNNPESRLYTNLPVDALQAAEAMSGFSVTGPRPTFRTFRFTHPAPPTHPGAQVATLNSAVVDGHMRPIFYITSNTHAQPAPPTSSLTDAQGRGLGLVEWTVHPFVQLSNAFPRQLVSSMLQVRSASTVVMVLNHRSYQWVRNPGEATMYFYDASCNPAELLAIVSREEDEFGTIVLNISPFALQQGLLEPVVLSTALLLSGRRLD